MKTVTVMNVLSEKKQIFCNGYDLETNLISAIIYSSEDSRKILDDEYRNYITQLAKIEYIKSLNGTNKVYSPVFDMISYES